AFPGTTRHRRDRRGARFKCGCRRVAAAQGAHATTALSGGGLVSEHDDDGEQITWETDPGLARLAEQITRRILAGEVVLAEDYIERYPQWAESLCELFPALRVL